MRKVNRLIIFDLDGTLADAYPAIIASFNYTMRRMGYPLQEGQVIRRSVGWGDKNLLKPFVKRKDLSKALLLYRRHHRQALLRKSRLYPSAARLLAYLKAKGYTLAIASNRPGKFCRILIRHLGIAKYFDGVICGDAVARSKPHPQILNQIMRRFRFQPDETVYIGDMVIDIQAGRRAGVKTIAVTSGSCCREELKKQRPGRIVSEVAELFRIF